MFTGIVEAPGEVVKAEPGRIWVRADVLAGREIGSSVANDGVCLTVVDRDGDVCAFDLSEETVARTTLGAKRVGDRVNVETPLRAGDDLGGHIVQGHVDGVGRVVRADDDGAGRRVGVAIAPELSRYVVEKGSVTLDGVSLTVTRIEDDVLEVALVPHTLEVTTLGTWEPGREVNVEVDVLAKYVERLVAPHRSGAS